MFKDTHNVSIFNIRRRERSWARAGWGGPNSRSAPQAAASRSAGSSLRLLSAASATARSAAARTASALSNSLVQHAVPAASQPGAPRELQAAQRPLFQALFAVGLGKDRHPKLEAAARPGTDAFFVPARELRDGDAADRLALTVATTAHGHAMLRVDKAFASVDEAAERAARAALALVKGRDAFAS
jgi:hypothetical protein